MKVLIFSFYDYHSDESVAETIYDLTFKGHSDFRGTRISEVNFFLNYTEKNDEYIGGIEYIHGIYFSTCLYPVEGIGAQKI